MSINKNRAEYLDGLRGVAAVAVMIFHLNVLISTAFPYEGILGFPRLMLGRLTNGNFAVCIFFVLSGYVLAAPFANADDRSLLGEAALRRYFRLTPVALASVLLSYAIWRTIGYHTKEMGEFGPGFAWMADIYNFASTLGGAIHNGLIGIYESDNSYNGPLWTISLEL